LSPGTRAVIAAPPAMFGPPPGIMSALDVPSNEVVPNLAAGVVGGDPFLRMAGNMLYVINRDDGDNITVVDANTITLVTQIATGTASNPQDVAVVGDKLYVPALGTAGVVVLSQSSGMMTKTIDLNTATGETDGQPDCVSAFAVGTDVYVACDLLDETDMNMPPKGNGKIVVIDSTTDSVRTTITLPVPNPQNEFAQLPDMSLLIAAEDFSDASNGCIVRVTPGANPNATCQIKNTDVNGTANHIAVDASGTAYISVASLDFTTNSLSSWAMGGSTVTNSISAASESITDVAVCPDGSIVAGDAAMAAPGFRVFKGGTELTKAALPFGEPPGFGNGMVCYTAQ